MRLEGKQTKQCYCSFVEVKSIKIDGEGKKHKPRNERENTVYSSLFPKTKHYLLLLIRKIMSNY